MQRTTVTRWLAAAAFGLAVLLAGVGFADDPKPDGKPPQKTDEKKAEVMVGPPPELAELRKAVEGAARKGENVGGARRRLDALEKALTGKPWTKPKGVEPEPEPLPPAGVAPGIRPLPPGFAPEFPPLNIAP